ncbi:MAG: amino acid ABC transporter permease [Pseudomonadota bacterium]
MDVFDTFFNVEVMLRTLPMLGRGLINTVYLSVTSIIIGVIVGVVWCLLRLYGPRPVRWIVVFLIDVFRAVPILVILVVIYYALPGIGIVLSPFTAAVMGLSLVLAAFTAEVFRAGIQSLPKGQFEAADALGLPFLVTLWKVILPQAVRVAIPPQTSNCVGIAKDTSLASVVAMPDLLKEAMNGQALTANPSPLIAAAIIYFVILWPAVRLVSYLENRARRGREA